VSPRSIATCVLRIADALRKHDALAERFLDPSSGRA
jgi:hypothetical protein